MEEQQRESFLVRAMTDKYLGPFQRSPTMEQQGIHKPLRRDQMLNELPSYGSIASNDASRRPPLPTTMRPNMSVDEFGDLELEKSNVNKIMRTGRQRKKIASRSKGGEFQQRRKKRRVYFCCLSNEIDIEQLHDNFDKLEDSKWMSRMYEGVLHIHNTPPQSQNIMIAEKIANDIRERESDDYFQGSPDGYETPLGIYSSHPHGYSDYLTGTVGNKGALPIISEEENVERIERNDIALDRNLNQRIDRIIDMDDSLGIELNAPHIPHISVSRNEKVPEPYLARSLSEPLGLGIGLLSRQQSYNVVEETDHQTAAMLVLTGGKEVFVFDFGAVVFWGFKHGEEEEFLEQIRYHVVKDCLSQKEFEEGQDDMAFVTSPEIEKITIANDVITLPDYASAKSRLSVSFAIAQSAVLAIFEARIERKTEDYRYIPETLAARGKVTLSAKQLGGMIGEVYVIRHDVNLHSEILDTPDFFWKEDASVEDEYKLTMRYLEMENRTEILNKRLDMLRELLGVLQQQHENAHAMNVEWIVIWLIIVSVVLEVFAILTNVFS